MYTMFVWFNISLLDIKQSYILGPFKESLEWIFDLIWQDGLD